MLWRSNLNEAIRAEAASRAQKRRRWLFASPALGLATAAALAFVVFFPRPAPARAERRDVWRRGWSPCTRIRCERTTSSARACGPRRRSPRGPPDYDPLDDLDAGAL